jgi:hypothetical protein
LAHQFPGAGIFSELSFAKRGGEGGGLRFKVYSGFQRSNHIAGWGKIQDHEDKD